MIRYKNTHKILSLFFCTLIYIFIPAYVRAEEDHSMNEVSLSSSESKQADKDETNLQIEKRNQEAVSLDEGIAADQIIVKINEEGYVTSHGDHFHSYSGHVPTDSIFMEQLLVSDNYTLKEDDKVSKIDGGWIVKVDNEFRVFLNNPEQASNIRSSENLMLQSYDVNPSDAQAMIALKHDLQSSEDARFIASVEQSYSSITTQQDREFIIVYITAKEFLAYNGENFYLFLEKIPETGIFSDHLLVPQEYSLNKKDIQQSINGGAIVKINEQNLIYLSDPSHKENIRQLKKQ
ncbi:pneumococcal-type histidine triad protein [Facklamia sp. DSM 111018]|uniref:Pneumococcal-type histidine triad protein n=1 Tax=Facklamia lactis TaxID=2749967 RepID=A0ABS0LUN8_9LACT|nr:pneumococcal-type histidine triad protein [Facklamia lactis]MBG9987019.1 pneumococcal-type histidine triad protein [Facklamia lactis]